MRAEADPNGTPLFRELRGEYVDDAGQVVTLREYLDFFEPLGTALSRLPDGAGGPFLYQFSGGGGRVIGAIGWVVNASAKRYGAWKLWGMWADRPIPPLTLPLLWPDLRDARRLPDLVARANDHAGRLLRPDAWGDVLDEIDATRLHDARFRTLLKAHLARAWRARDGRDRPIEVELASGTLDLLPWLHLLGPFDPEQAQVQPNRFNGPGYQYILGEAAPAEANKDVPKQIDEMVDAAASDVLEGWNMAAALREKRSRPRAVPPPVRRRASPEVSEMPTQSPKPAPNLGLVRDVIMIALLAWIGFNVHMMRKTLNTPPAPAPAVAVSEPAAEPEPKSEQAPTPTRAQRLADALAANPPRNMQIAPAVLESIRRDDADSRDVLGRVAIEIFLRRNACHARGEVVDGKFSTAEQRSIRNCAILTRERLMTSDGKPHPERSVDWLERTLAR